MPYIKREERKLLDPKINKLYSTISIETKTSKGAMNYAITCLIHNYIKEKGIKYSVLSDATGILTDVLAELQRTVIANYEKEKIEENGIIGILDHEISKECKC